MFVTIAVLIDELDVVKEHVYTASLAKVDTETYLTHRRGDDTHYGYTPVRVIVTRRGSQDIHVVEFTGCHYVVSVMEHDASRCWWVNTGCMPDTIVPDTTGLVPQVYTFKPFTHHPDVRPLTEAQSLFHDYALTLADDYFNDRFHLANLKKG